MANTIPVIVIYFEHGEQKKFVSACSRRPDRKLIPLYDENIKHARQYTTEEEAATAISSLYNPHNRDFKTMPHEVSNVRKNGFRHPLMEDEL